MKKAVLLIIFSLMICDVNAQDCLNVKFKLRGYFYAGTSQIDSMALGGFYEAKNKPKTLTSDILSYSNPKTLQVIVKANLSTEYKKGIAGFKVFVVNTSDSICQLPAQDSRLYIKRQVYYKDEWRDIEYLPSSWCGNSYHNVYIKPNEYWDFNAPCLQGRIKAKFRFQLYINNKLTLYSNEFEGSFNKRQLKKEQGHKPTDIMDPYDN